VGHADIKTALKMKQHRHIDFPLNYPHINHSQRAVSVPRSCLRIAP
jgi:hypothetical protein